MSGFEVIEFQFEDDDFSLTLEDEFQVARLSSELDKVSDPHVLREAAKKLLCLATQRQAIVRTLVKRLAKLEVGSISRCSMD